MKEYRRNPLEFHSNFDKEDVIMAEDYIMETCCTDRESAQIVLKEVCKKMFDLDPYEEDEVAYTARETRCIISYIDDVGENKGGYYCEVRREFPYYDCIDDFVIHTTDVDCKDWDAVVAYAKDYVSHITEY